MNKEKRGRKPRDLTMDNFHKWCISKAEGFEVVIMDGIETVRFIRGDYIFSFRLKIIECSLIYPLLLQKTIEGVNNISDYEIIQKIEYVEVYYMPDNTLDIVFESKFIDEPDQAKKSVLKYVYEQEKLNG